MEKRCCELKHLQDATLHLQKKLDEILNSRQNPLIKNANSKWKTRNSSESEAAAALVILASKNGEACSHQTQFVQDRRLSDSFDFQCNFDPFLNESFPKSGNDFGLF